MPNRATILIHGSTTRPLEQRWQVVSASNLYTLLPAAMLLSVTISTTAGAQTLSFGASGAGGTGPWDTTTANWFNGSAAVRWIGGSTAALAERE